MNKNPIYLWIRWILMIITYYKYGYCKDPIVYCNYQTSVKTQTFIRAKDECDDWHNLIF